MPEDADMPMTFIIEEITGNPLVICMGYLPGDARAVLQQVTAAS